MENNMKKYMLLVNDTVVGRELTDGAVLCLVKGLMDEGYEYPITIKGEINPKHINEILEKIKEGKGLPKL